MHHICPEVQAEHAFAMMHLQPLPIQFSLRDIEFRRSQKTTIVSGFFWSLEQQGEQIFRKLWRGYFVTLWQANRPTQWWRGRCLQLCCLSPLSLRTLCFSAFILHSTYVFVCACVSSSAMCNVQCSCFSALCVCSPQMLAGGGPPWSVHPKYSAKVWQCYKIVALCLFPTVQQSVPKYGTRTVVCLCLCHPRCCSKQIP